MKQCYLTAILLLLMHSPMLAGEKHSSHFKLSPSETVFTDTISYPRALINNEWIIVLPDVFIWGGNPALAEKKKAEWTRLRNAVYVTYPYARQAGVVMKDVLQHLEGIKGRSERRKYIRSREKELRDAFGDKISDLSVYQGKVLMKLINRQTGDDCYEIIKEMKGGLTARLYQTILFFVGSDLKQSWEPGTNSNDRLIESFVREINQMYYPDELTPNGISGL
jgi:hypothetical protein